MKFFHLILYSAIFFGLFFCQTIPKVTQQEINSVNDLATELKKEIKSDEKAGLPVDYKKRAIVEKLENYSQTLIDKSKQEKQLKDEKELADKYRTIRNIFITIVTVASLIGIGILVWKFRRLIPGLPPGL